MLHGAADALLDDLEERFDVQRTTVADDERVERLDPAGGGAALVVTFTAFPGVKLAFGRSAKADLPHCGCDACDEQPDELVDELARIVDAVVAGRFGEELTAGRPRELRFWWSGGRSRRGSVESARATELGPPGRIDWPAWQRR